MSANDINSEASKKTEERINEHTVEPEPHEQVQSAAEQAEEPKAQTREALKKEKQQQEKQQKEKDNEQVKKRVKVRLIPIWLRLVIIFLLLVFSLWLARWLDLVYSGTEIHLMSLNNRHGLILLN